MFKQKMLAVDMKKILLGFTVLVGIIVFTGCLKSKESSCPYTDRTIYAPDSQVTSLRQYLTDNNITPTGKDTSGVFYQVLTTGAGDTADVCSLVTVNYKGTLLNGTVFDQTTSTPASFRVGDLIVGFQKGMKYVGVGGRVRFFIPFGLAYGTENVTNPNTGAVIIPGKSHLIFEVELLGLQ